MGNLGNYPISLSINYIAVFFNLEKCTSVCTDGAAAMVGHNKGFVSRVKERNPDVTVVFFAP